MVTLNNGCSGSIIGHNYILTGKDCCTNDSMTALLQDGKVLEIVNFRVNEAGLCLLEVENAMEYSQGSDNTI
jgi:hypothetical protein